LLNNYHPLVKIQTLTLIFLCALYVTIPLHAQDPGAQQDAEAARQKLLKASDELDNIQANSEATRLSVEGMKADVTHLQADVAKLQADNASLRQQLDSVQAAFDKAEAAHAKERQVLLDTVAEMIKESNPGKPSPKKKEKAAASSQPKAPPADVTPAPAASGTAAAVTPDATTPAGATNSLSPPADSDSGPVKSPKGYYHIVASGETLTLICNAYRQQGVSVSVDAVEKANGLTDKSVLRVGQKLFIPKPGT